MAVLLKIKMKCNFNELFDLPFILSFVSGVLIDLAVQYSKKKTLEKEKYIFFNFFWGGLLSFPFSGRKKLLEILTRIKLSQLPMTLDSMLKKYDSHFIMSMSQILFFFLLFVFYF